MVVSMNSTGVHAVMPSTVGGARPVPAGRCRFGVEVATCLLGERLLQHARQVHPGPHLDPQSLLDLYAKEGATCSAGVPKTCHPAT